MPDNRTATDALADFGARMGMTPDEVAVADHEPTGRLIGGNVVGGTYVEDPTGRDYRKERDAAYTERNRLVAALARLVVASGGEAWLAPHPEDPEWDPEWRTIVFIDGPTGLMSWHLHDSDVALFDGLPHGKNTWDGHTTAEKYRRVDQLGRGVSL